MLRLTEGTRVYVACGYIDFRKSINGLAALVHEQFDMAANDGSVYVFASRDCSRVKCLFWDKNGFVLYQKRLERGRFKFEKSEDRLYAISHQQLDWLFAGLDFKLMAQFPMLDFSLYF